MMKISDYIIVVVMGLHIWFLILEMFFWDKPLGVKAFGHSLEQAKKSRVLAANQGLYNGFLAVGLLWGLLSPVDIVAYQVKIFFLNCIFVAGVYGAFTANKKIFFIQALPAVIALSLLLLENIR